MNPVFAPRPYLFRFPRTVRQTQDEEGAMAVLEHEGECVAAWRYDPGLQVIACPGCMQRYPATPERRFAAEFDNILSRHMDKLAVQGTALLDPGTQIRPRWTR